MYRVSYRKTSKTAWKYLGQESTCPQWYDLSCAVAVADALQEVVFFAVVENMNGKVEYDAMCKTYLGQ